MASLEFEGKIYEIPEPDSMCPTWRLYYDQLEKDLGDKDEAKLTWLLTWQHNGSVSCTTNASFNRWAKSKGIDVSNMATRTLASGSKIVENVAGLGANMTSMFRYGLPVISIGLLVIVGLALYKSAQSGKLPAIANAHPLGRAANSLLG